MRLHSFDAPDALWAELQAAAKSEDISVAYLMRRTMKAYLARAVSVARQTKIRQK